VSEHVLQLVDTTTSLASGVCRFLRAGVQAGDVSLLIVATAPHWDAIRDAAPHYDLDLKLLTQTGQLSVLDATDSVQRLMVAGRINWRRFDALIGEWVRRRVSKGKPVRVYGEAVDVLVRAGDFGGALQLEEFWNQLVSSHPFELLCTYMAEHFGNPRDAESLRSVCRLHSHVGSDAQDVLSGYLLKTRAAC
jgi:hypothetical protein